MTETLSIEQARKLVLLSQRLPPKKQSGSAIDATFSAIEHLGYIQIDTISVVERAHHHVLWCRNTRHRSSDLDRLIDEKKVFEYWSHAAAYLPMHDFRFSLVRKEALKSGKQKQWFSPDKKALRSVLKRIETEGPLMAKDFEDTRKTKTKNAWTGKPAKQALEYLFAQGDLMIAKRNKFQKVYDLTERVLPDGIDMSTPSAEEYARFLITSFLRANALGQASEMGYLRKHTKKIIADSLSDMIDSGEVIRIMVKNETYFALSASLKMLSKPLSRNRASILSPFDNLLIQRKRMQRLFGFDYQIECYVPAPKRNFGYFSLPVLWDGRLVARLDCKANRKTAQLIIHHLALEPTLKKRDVFGYALQKELQAFARFNECDSIVLDKTTPKEFKREMPIVTFD